MSDNTGPVTLEELARLAKRADANGQDREADRLFDMIGELMTGLDIPDTRDRGVATVNRLGINVA